MPPSNADLEQGRELYANAAWAGAFESFKRADQSAPLEASDLVLLSQSAYLLGREDEFMKFLERAHHAYLDGGEILLAVRCAFWLGMNLALRGEVGPATGWLGRAQRLVERESEDCVERGYLLMPVAFQHDAAGDLEGASATAAAAAEIGERFGDRDLVALAMHGQGGWLIKAGRVREGLGLLDEAMVAATTGALSPIVTGIVYCGVIAACEEVYELRRAQEWTAALKEWCDRQPELMAFTGRCMVHRAEIMQLHGAWTAAVEEAQRAGARFERAMNTGAAAKASYLQGDVHRLRGELDAAEDAYKEASRFGWEPQPGLALLRLAQGRGDAAAAAIRRVMGETTETLRRASLLPAYVQIMLAVGDAAAAGDACRELAEISEQFESDVLAAMLDQAWQELQAPYEAARVRVLLGLACRAVGDEDAFELELDAARATFDELGAAPDVAWVDSLAGRVESADAYGLTPRELEVLRLVATGKSNREIAAALVISEHTVARHVQNIFTKLGVPSRMAAGAFAFEHDLV